MVSGLVIELIGMGIHRSCHDIVVGNYVGHLDELVVLGSMADNVILEVVVHQSLNIET